MIDIIINTIIKNLGGFVVGFLSSLTVWFTTIKIFVPKIEISDDIIKKTESNAPPVFRFRIRNKGWREVFDIKVSFIVTIKSLSWSSHGSNRFRIIIGFDNIIPALQANTCTDVVVNAQTCSIINSKNCPANIKSKYEAGKLTLDDIFALSSDVEADVVIVGYDSVNGTKRNFLSHKYKKENIVEGQFIGSSIRTNNETVMRNSY